MQDTILKICKQIHEKLPTKRIAITRFVGKYEYGQIYVGELDREVKREPCGYMFAKRNFCVVYSQDPTKDQETARQDFETVCQKLEDEAPFFYEPHWYKTFFDVFETTLILEFQVYERYERKPGTPTPLMEDLETSYPSIIYEGDIPEPEPEPEPPEPEPEYLEGIIGETFTIPEGKTVDRLESQYLYFNRGGGNGYYYGFWKYEGESGYYWNNFWKYLPSYDLVKDLPYEGTWYVHSFATDSWVELNSSNLSETFAMGGDPRVFVYPCNRPDYLVVYKNGEWWKMGSGAYTISGNMITFPANTNENPSYGKPFRVYFAEQ